MEVSKYTKLPFKNGIEGWELRQTLFLCHIAVVQLFLHTCGIQNANSLALCEDRERERKKTNKMQQSDVYYQLLSQHVSGIIMPIFRRNEDRVLLRTVYCAGSAGCGW